MVPLDPLEAELFERFRVLRERIFEGSDAFRQRVRRGVEQHVKGKPAEPLATALVVHALNFLSSVFAKPTDPPSEEEDEPSDRKPPR